MALVMMAYLVISVKSTFEEIAAPVATVFNTFLKTCNFPDKLKIAKIIPIYKCDDRRSVTQLQAYFGYSLLVKKC